MWKFSITTTLDAEDAVAELLGNVFAQPAATYADFATDRTTVAVYCDSQPDELPAKRAALSQGLNRIKRCGLDLGRVRIGVQKLRRENWAESWKRHFKPIEVRDALLVKPSWSKRRPRMGQAVVVLDPGLSFGTGQHPTTCFCLNELTRCRARGLAQSFLDLGTGSGILAIAAAKLGFSPIDAVDYDLASVRVAQANARKNRASKKIRILHRDLAKLRLRPARAYDLICANLLSTLLVAQCRRIVRRLKPGGTLVVAGMLKTEFGLVAKAYEAMGLRLEASRVEMGWRSGSFVLMR